MHAQVAKVLAEFYESNKSLMDSFRIAELGSLNINGSCRDVVPIDTGFDIVGGPGVHEVIVPGEIPSRYHHVFGAVVSVGSFQYCPDTRRYKKQIIDLLLPSGILFLTMCAPSCRGKHTTSNNRYGYIDSFRCSLEVLKAFFEPEFDLISSFETNANGHGDLVYIGQIKKLTVA